MFFNQDIVNILCETLLSNKTHHRHFQELIMFHMSWQNLTSANQGRLTAEKRINSFPHCFYIPTPPPLPFPSPRPSLSLHHRAHPSEHLLVPPAGEPVRFRRCTTSKASLIISSSCFTPPSHPPPRTKPPPAPLNPHAPSLSSHLFPSWWGGGSVLKRKPLIKA